MEPEQRGRASRASSTSSLGREVRCGCQYYQSDSLLPERRALLVRPSSRTMQQPPAVRCSEHEYEPIAPPPSLPHPAMAPVVRITDTDVMPVADSDDSIDDRGRLPPRLILDGDVVLPLDGKIEDSAMESRELGETGGDTSDEQEPTAQQLQERLEKRFLDAPTPHTESRTDGEINTSQVDSPVMEELPLRHGSRGLPQRIKSQAGKLRSRLRGLHRPTFSLSERQKPDKTRSTNGGKPEKSHTEKRPNRLDRIRISICERTRFSLPDRPKFSLPDKSKFHLPDRPKFNFPDKSRFHLPDRPKFTIKKPSIRLPSALTRVKRPASMREQQQQHSTESTAGSKRNIFDFSTYPRILDKISKKRGEHATSSIKDSQTESAESATFPRARKGKPFSARWAQRFGDSANVQEQERPEAASIGSSLPWHQSSLEEPRLSARTEEEIIAAARAIPWEDARKREHYDEDEIQYMDYEQESSEMSDRHPPPRAHKSSRKAEEYEREEAMEVDPKSYEEQEEKPVRQDEAEGDDVEETDWQQRMFDEKFRSIPRSRSLDEDIPHVLEHGGYKGTFLAVDPKQFGPRKMTSEEEEEEEEEDEELMNGEEEDHEPSSAQSDREQQPSSGSSCDRRRRGVIEEIDSDEFFLRESGISQDDMNLGKYLASEIRNALRSEVIDTFADNEVSPIPPQRPVRTRSLRKPKEDTEEEFNETVPPVRPKRERATARRSREASMVHEAFRERTRSDSRSDSRHQIVYQAEGNQEEPLQEPLDDIVIVKPARRKSRSSLRSQSQPPMETSILPPSTSATIVPGSSTPPIVPIRRKRSHRELVVDRRNGDTALYNGHREWGTESVSKRPVVSKVSRSQQSLERYDECDVVMPVNQEDVENLSAQLRQKDLAEPIPIPPKRRSRSRATSAADEDRTSHGAESLPETGYIAEDIPRDESDSARDLSGYAIVEKREKPPRPPPPRRKRGKFATTPRPSAPKRPQRAYSTLGPAKSRDTSISGTVMSEAIISASSEPIKSAPYIDVDDGEHKDLRSGNILNKIQGRPLPAPPRPPRTRREHTILERPCTPFEFAMETTAATQTDPLPDDVVIEEEITQAKLIVTPSRSGSQVTVSMERIPSPIRGATPPVPPLPMSQFLRKDEEPDTQMVFDTVSLTSPSPTREADLKNKHMSAPHLEEHVLEESQTRSIRSLLSNEPLRISSLEVGDLKVDRLSVSQIEAHKIVASEVDAMMITTSELRGGSSFEESLSPAIIKELIAIRSHLETVATSQAQERYRESEKEYIDNEITDIPTAHDSQVEERERSQEHSQEAKHENVVEQALMEDEKTEADKDEKVVKTDVVHVKDKEISHTFSVARTKDLESPSSQTFVVDELVSKGKHEPITHLLTVRTQSTQDKSLRILDSEHPLTLSSRDTSGFHVDKSRASFPPSDMPSTQPSESRVSPERVGESSSSSAQTTEPTATSVDLHSSKDDVSDSTEQISRKSRSRSPSPSKGILRQTASPVRSLPPAISVTPDAPDTTPRRGVSTDAQPQRAIISYSSDTKYGILKDAQPQRAIISHFSETGQPLKETQRESSQSPVPSFPLSSTHFIAFPASEIPAQFFSLSESPSQPNDSEPGIVDTTQQLLRALRSAGIKAMRHFLGYLASTLSKDDTREKVREVELAICALLLLIAGMLIYYFSSSQIVTHHHHWDYFNPPQ